MNINIIFIIGVFVSGIITLINPFWVLPIFMFGHFVEPVHWFPELQKYNPGVTVGLVVFGLWLFHILIYGDAVPARSAQAKMVILLITTLFVSTIVGSNANPAVTIAYLRSIVPYFIFLYFVKTRKEVIIVVWLILFFGVIASLYGIYCLKANIGLSEGYGYKRIMSFFDNPNAFGETMTLLIPFAMALLFAKNSPRVKMVVLSILAFLIVGTVISFSRKCFFAMVAALLLSVFMYFKGSGKMFKAMTILTFAMVIIFALFPDSVKWRFESRVRTIFRAESAETLDIGRVETTKAGWEMLIRNPILGVGPGAFKSSYVDIAATTSDISLVAKSSTNSDALGAHNVFVEVGAQLGSIGLFLYILIIFFAYKDFCNAGKAFFQNQDNLMRSISIAGQVFIITNLIIGMFTSVLDEKIFWMILPLSIILKRLSKEPIETINNVSS